MRCSALILCLALCFGCDDPPEQTPPQMTEDASPDTPLPEDTAEPDAPPRPEPGERVELDLGPWLEGVVDSEDGVEVFEAAGPGDLLEGDVAMGRAGDWVLQNGRARFVVERDVNAIGPCPYGGNIIDAAPRSPQGDPGVDESGEVCLFLNAGRTFKPSKYEVLPQSESGVGVLAVTGDLPLLDFVHIKGMASELLAGVEIEIPIDPEAELPLTATLYHILKGGERRVQVITALRNDGDEVVHVLFSHIVHAGGAVEYFNPLGATEGFGYEGLAEGAFRADPLPFLGFRGRHTSHVYVPETDPRLSEGNVLPVGGSSLIIAGAAIVMLKQPDILPALLTQADAIPTLPGALHIEPGQVAHVSHSLHVGDSGLSSALDGVYGEMALPTAMVEGAVRDEDGEPVAGVRVSAVQEGRAFNQGLTDDAGRYAMRVPQGEVLLRAHLPGRSGRAEVSVSGDLDVDIEIGRAGKIVVQVATPEGAPTPARVMVLCEGECPEGESAQDRDVSFDPPGGGAVRIEYAGVEGRVELDLAPGSYRVVVSRGATWSVWPPDALETLGHLVEVGAGEIAQVSAEIAQVVSTHGVVGADLHIHALRSLDSPIPHEDRVLGFMAGGVDVVVATDHDVVTDYGPTIEALGAESEIRGVVGEELTTANYGHYNAFPVPYDDAAPNGGAFDWSGGTGVGHTPAEIFEQVRGMEGEQVIQVNHPEANGLIGSLKADPLRGITLADPVNFRLPPTTPDPLTGDTGLWSDGFTAMEVMNGTKMGRFWARFRWWLQMIGRGFAPAGTAVTDTHTLKKTDSGTPRTWVFVPEGQDSPQGLNQEAFAEAINAGRIIGSNGPFFRVVAVNSQGERGGLGETLETRGEPVSVEVSLELPEWMQVDTIDVYENLTEAIITEPGQSVEDPVAPTFSMPIEWGPDALVTVAQGVEVHRHRVGTFSFERSFDSDAYLIVVVRGASVPSMYPASLNGGLRPFAFANPIFFDADGGGYDNPPLEEAARREIARPPLGSKVRRPMEKSDLPRFIEALEASH